MKKIILILCSIFLFASLKYSSIAMNVLFEDTQIYQSQQEEFKRLLEQISPDITLSFQEKQEKLKELLSEQQEELLQHLENKEDIHKSEAYQKND